MYAMVVQAAAVFAVHPGEAARVAARSIVAVGDTRVAANRGREGEFVFDLRIVWSAVLRLAEQALGGDSRLRQPVGDFRWRGLRIDEEHAVGVARRAAAHAPVPAQTA